MSFRPATLMGIVLLANGWSAPVSAGTATAAAPKPVAVHHHHRHHAAHTAAANLPEAAPPNEAAPSTSGPAPVPNEALNAPIEDPHPETSVAPSVFQLHYPPQGEGYTTGSSAQALDDREAARATGVEVKVPLPQ